MADRSGCIMCNDQITEVDGAPLLGVSNAEAVEMLKRTGNPVRLAIVRYLRGIKFEELCAGIKKANVATPTAPFPPAPATAGMAMTTPPNSNTTAAPPPASLPQDEGEPSSSA